MKAMGDRLEAEQLGRRKVTSLLVAAVLGLTACGRKADEAYKPAYERRPSSDKGLIVHVLGVHPLHNPQHLFEVYGPLVAYLNARLKGVSIRLEASSSYAAFEEKIARRELHFCLANPYEAIASLTQGYHVFAKMADDQNFRGIILVRKDSGITRVEQLRGKIVSYPAPTALAAAVMPQWFLFQHGIDVMHDLDNHYVGTQESSIMNVVLGKSVAGGTWPPPWKAFQREHPDLASQVEVRWQTPSLINNALIARDDVAPEVVSGVRELLATLHTDPEGPPILARMDLSRFEPAANATYEPVRAFVQRFEASVRPVKLKS